MKRISVVLCTFNGEQYIIEQLRSIEEQSVTPFEVIIVDDNSADTTKRKIQEYIVHSKLNIKFIANEKRRGVVQNFEYALSLARGEYIALSDQDDIWLKNKLELSLSKIMQIEKDNINTPILVHSDMMVVNENLDIRYESFMKCEGFENKENEPAKYLCVHNYITGCTMMFNRKALDLVLPFPKNALLHDWWIALAVSICGRIGFINNKTVMYRQHSSNVVGAHKYISLQGFYNACKFQKRLSRIEELLLQLQDAINYKNSLLVTKAPWLCKGYMAMKNANILMLSAIGIKQQGKIRNFLFYFMLIIRYVYKRV